MNEQPDEQSKYPSECRPGALPYASRISRNPRTRLEKSLIIALYVSYPILSLATTAALFHIPGERSLFSENFEIGPLGFVAAITSPVILMASLFTRSWLLVGLASGLVAIAIIFAARFLVLLSYL